MTYRVTLRDRLAHRLANAAIRLATRPYRGYLTTVVGLGHKEFDRIVKEEKK